MRSLRLRSVALVFVAGAVALAVPRRGDQRAFATPQEAAHTVVEAAENNDIKALLKILGPEGKSIVASGDPAEDREDRARFARLAREKLQIRQDANHDTIVAGSDEWPFPVPLVEKNGRWWFDSSAGKVEVLARRIGRNEMDAIEVCRGYVEAQMEYAHGRGAGGKPEYAQTIASSPGKQNGLYREGDPRTLLPRSFAQAAASMFAAGRKPAPYHGYYFRILKAQGPDADGGAVDYVVKGAMAGGFALVAYPAEYGVSGIRSFIVNHKALVYEKDLGPTTSALGRRMTRFNPDSTWKAVVLK